MPPRPLIIVAIIAVVIVAAGGGLLAWDAGRADVIGKDVSVGSVDVSGLTRSEARARLRSRLLAPLQAPLVVRAADRKFTLTAREAHITANLDAIVDDAVRRSRTGGVPGRAWRALSGSGVDARITAKVDYSTAAVQRVVDRVRTAVSRPAQDAQVQFGRSNVSIRHSQPGRAIDAGKLRRDVQAVLVSPTGSRTVTAPIRTIEPKVSGDKLADRYPVVVTIDRAGFRLNLFKRLQRVKTYPIAVGQVGLETPAGLYAIQNKAPNPAWHVPNSEWAGELAGQVIPGGAPNNPIKARWLGIYDGVGVHGTDARNSIGTNASHGCIRMLIEDVEKLYDEVPVGAPIYID